MKKLVVLMLLAGLAGLLSAFVSGNNPASEAEIALGKRLFFEPMLSHDQSISCASCHKPQFAFADSIALTPGVYGRKGKRNTPSAMNVRLQATYFWDGRARTLEQQALMPIENHDEMDMNVDSVLSRLKGDAGYREAFLNVFNEQPSRANLAKALSSFMRDLETNDSPFDEWRGYDDPEAVSDAAKRGFAIFNTKGKCIQCHFGADFNNPEFRNIGLFDGKQFNDSGRAAITHVASDLGKFKIGPLRNLAVTAPYMHNGMFKTLAEVIEFYNDPAKVVPGGLNRDSLLAKPLGLTAGEKKDLEAFLLSLTDRRFLATSK